MPSISPLPRKNTTTASAAEGENFGDSEEGTYSRHSMPMIRAHIARLKSHSVKGQETLTSVSVLRDDYAPASGDEGGTASERIKTWGSDTVEKDNLKVKAPRCIPKPTAALAMKMMKGSNVNIIVSAEKKSFELPKELLAYYSPAFDRCFNGRFKEAEIQAMDLPEDTVEDFQVLVEYILYINVTEALSVAKCGRQTVARYVSFLLFADKYDLGDISATIYSPFRLALIECGAHGFEASYIANVFRTTKGGNCLWDLIADAVITIHTTESKVLRFDGKGPFQKQQDEVEGFSVAIMRHCLNSISNCDIEDPLTQKQKVLLY